MTEPKTREQQIAEAQAATRAWNRKDWPQAANLANELLTMLAERETRRRTERDAEAAFIEAARPLLNKLIAATERGLWRANSRLETIATDPTLTRTVGLPGDEQGLRAVIIEIVDRLEAAGFFPDT